MGNPAIKQAMRLPAQLVASRFGPHRRGNAAAQLWVLMYHRILPAADSRYRQEEPGMVTTPQTFRHHLQQVRRLFTPVSLAEWVDRRRQGLPLPQRACAVTFDDGWKDNFEFAFPVLQSEQVPATIFAVTHMIGTKRDFWPNRLARLLARSTRTRRESPAFAWLRDIPSFASDGDIDRERLAAIINDCKALPEATLLRHLDDMEAQHEGDVAAPALMNWDELRTLQKSGLVDIGSHTTSHVRLLDAIGHDAIEHEVVDSKRLLEEQLGLPPRLFCYPNGDFSPAVAELVAKHYSAAVTTVRGINGANDDAFSLKRISIHEDGSHTPLQFEARLSAWF